MDVQVEPPAKRRIVFEVSEQEARTIAGWLDAALRNRHTLNTPYSSNGAFEVYRAFAKIGE